MTFGVSGKLVMNALVMYDHQTDSLWSHFTGDALTGELAGARLEVLPVYHTTWGRWVQEHPDTLVLDKRGGYVRDVYEGYYVSGSTGIIPETQQDERLPGKELVVGVRVKGATKAYGFTKLGMARVHNDMLEGQPLVVTFDGRSETGSVFDRRVNGRTLTFQAQQPYEDSTLGIPVMVDAETMSRWNAITGEAISGELAGQQLSQVPTTYSFWFAWKDYHTETEVFG